MVWLDVVQAEAMTCQSTQVMIPQDVFVFDGNQTKKNDEDGQTAIFEVKFGNKTGGVTTESRGRTAELLCDNLESFALAVEGSDLSTAGNQFVPTASCIQDTKKRQLVTWSGLP